MCLLLHSWSLHSCGIDRQMTRKKNKINKIESGNCEVGWEVEGWRAFLERMVRKGLSGDINQESEGVN